MTIFVYCSNSTIRDAADATLTAALGSFDGWVNPSGTVYYNVFPVTWEQLDDFMADALNGLYDDGAKVSVLYTNHDASDVSALVTAAASEANFFVDMTWHNAKVVSWAQQYLSVEPVDESDTPRWVAGDQQKAYGQCAMNAFTAYSKLYTNRANTRTEYVIPDSLTIDGGGGVLDLRDKAFVFESPQSGRVAVVVSNATRVLMENCETCTYAVFEFDETCNKVVVAGNEFAPNSDHRYYGPERFRCHDNNKTGTRVSGESDPANGSDLEYGMFRASNQWRDAYRTRPDDTDANGISDDDPPSTSNYVLDGTELLVKASYVGLFDGLTHEHVIDIGAFPGLNGGSFSARNQATRCNVSAEFIYYRTNHIGIDNDYGDEVIGFGDGNVSQEWAFICLRWSELQRTLKLRSNPPAIGYQLLNYTYGCHIIDCDVPGGQLRIASNSQPCLNAYVYGGVWNYVTSRTYNIGFYESFAAAWHDSNLFESMTINRVQYYGKSTPTKLQFKPNPTFKNCTFVEDPDIVAAGATSLMTFLYASYTLDGGSLSFGADYDDGVIYDREELSDWTTVNDFEVNGVALSNSSGANEPSIPAEALP